MIGITDNAILARSSPETLPDASLPLAAADWCAVHVFLVGTVVHGSQFPSHSPDSACCLGLTGWTACFDIALRNFARNILSAFSDLQFTDQDVIEDQDTVTIRTRNERTCAFPGVPATGRRGAWDNTSLLYTQDGRIVGQWVQPDLWRIYQQITAPTPEVPRSVAVEPPVEWGPLCALT